MRPAASFLSHGNMTSLNTLCFEKKNDAIGKKDDSYANNSFPSLFHRTGHAECFLFKSILLTYHLAAFEDCCLLA